MGQRARTPDTRDAAFLVAQIEPDADHPDGSAAKYQKIFLAISVAPLGLIGVVLALLPTGTPMGFVAILGIVALSGMIVRNSVILVDQIDMDIARGLHPWDAVIDATIHRLRPIVLTAAADLLGMTRSPSKSSGARWLTPSSAVCSSRPS
jgi:hypothetical protein